MSLFRQGSFLQRGPVWIGSGLKNREFWVISPVYAFLSFINLSLKIGKTPAWLDGTLLSNHSRLMDFQYFNNEQSRIFQYLIPQAIAWLLDCSMEYAYMIQRLLFVFLALLCFHFYMRKWFSSMTSFSGVLFLAAVMPFTYMNDLQESSPLLMLLFVLGLWAIREHQDILFLLILWLGGFTNETALILPAVYFFYNFPWTSPKNMRWHTIRSWLKLAGVTILLSIPGFLTQGIIRFINRFRPHLGGDIINWTYNIDGIIEGFQTKPWLMYQNKFLYFILVFSIFWLYALLGYRRSGLFLQRASWMIPLFILGHLITGKIDEPRQMIPLAFVIIPMALTFVFPVERAVQESRPVNVDSIASAP